MSARGSRTDLSAAEARRAALAAQGFGAVPARAAGARRIAALFGRLGLVQIDSVNVVVRAHYVPLYSRLGPYEIELLHGLAYRPRDRALFEYWGHEASLIAIDLQPLLRWRMERARRGGGTWGRLARFAHDDRAVADRVLAEIRARGPLAAADVEGHTRGGSSWWGWSEAKAALEFLFWSGEITTAFRTNFARSYDLVERVLPPEVLARPTPDEAAAQRELLRISARALGVATESDLRDYFRLDAADAKARVAELVALGDLQPVAVEGWKQRAYLARDARIPRTIAATTLLSPFDALIWNRDRARRLFAFDYRIEIYTPAAKREHGYYVLPFLCGERIVARVDLKAHRRERTLEAIAVHYEDRRPPAALRAALHDELVRFAAWLGLDHVRVAGAAGARRERPKPEA